MKYIVMDIDGCISDDVWRRHMLPLPSRKGEERQAAYHTYHLAAKLDQAKNLDVISNARLAGFDIIFLTGRPTQYRNITTAWLHHNAITDSRDVLLMRPSGNRQPAPELKVEMLQKHIRMNGLPDDCIVMCYDNEPKIVEAYIAAGYNAQLLCAEDSVVPAPLVAVAMGDGQDASGSAEQEKNEVWAILEAAAATYKERNEVYGSNFLNVAPMMAAMFPGGVPEGLPLAVHWHLFELMVVKLSRFANSGLTHIDSIHDACVYAAMIESILRKEVK